MKVKHLDGLPKRKVTVDELIEADQITELLDGIYQNRCEIDQFVMVYTLKDGSVRHYWHGTRERLMYALESAKMRVMQPEENEV